uniref:uncharacterized protein LOC120825788 isoform X2 n=1 Tax=Gasterosteus aculeatus aculeatus TaxID=481459 RepID=UPI001A99C11C|nr:uncharacterized protein LOC120825788 isoform X2 [Gasterosteus aculeatus aculeatus]
MIQQPTEGKGKSEMQKEVTMQYTLLHTLVWLLPAFSTQELVSLSVSPDITAECGKPVTLICNASSSQRELSIKRMEWFQNRTSVCSVNEEGDIRNHAPSTRDSYCEYKHGQFSLTFKSAKPLDRGSYACKLQSSRGARHKVTKVELQECCGKAEGVWTKDRLTCIFRNVYPDGDVHWFNPSRNLSYGSVRRYTSKQVDEGGWLTIQSDLDLENLPGPNSCSLMSPTSGRYIASTLVLKPQSRSLDATQKQTDQSGSGVGSHRPMWTFLFSAVLLGATLN